MKAAEMLAGSGDAAAPGLSVGQPARGAGWSTVGASAFGLSVGPSCMTILAFGAFIAPLEREFHWGIPAIATGASIIAIMMMILCPIQGLLVDRFGGRRLVLWSIPFFALSLCAMYLLPNDILVFYLAWIIIPICAIGVWPISYLRTTAGWFDKNLGLALGCANAGVGVGTMLVPLISAYLIGWYGWREAYLGLGAIAFAAWPVAYLFLKDPSSTIGGIAFDGETLSEAARLRSFWVILGAFFFLGLFTTALIVHQVKILIDAGISPSVATSIPAAFGASLIAARLGTGWLLDRFPASRIMFVLLFGCAVAALLLARGPDVPVAVLSAVLIGAVTGAEFDVLSYIIPRYYGRRSFGKIYGVVFAIFQLSSAIGVIVVGTSRARFGSYAPAMVGVTLICLIAAVLFMVVGPYRYRQGQRI